MKLPLHFLSLIGVYNALTVSDELKALVNFDQWAQTSIANHNHSGKVPASIGVPHEDLPLVVYRLLKKSNTWASGHLLDLAQRRFHNQAYEMESRTLLLMSDLISLEHVKPHRVERCLSRMNNLSKKGSELSELISAWSWAVGSFKSSNSVTNRINLDYQSTARAAQRLRAMRADLLTLLANVPMQDEKSQLFDNDDNEMIMNAKIDNEEGSTSGDWDVDVKQLMSDNNNSRDIALMVRHGLLDDMMQNANVDLDIVPTSDDSDDLSATIIEPDNDKEMESQYTEYYTTNIFDEGYPNMDTEIIEDNVPMASLDDNPTFDKVILHRQRKLVTGENSNSTGSKSQWLTLSVVGSLAAIVLTVTLTVFARRIKSGKNNESGTPVQKLRRFNLKNSPQNQQQRGHGGHGFNGYNAAYRPQSMDSGMHDYSTNSSQISSSSGSFVPQTRQHKHNNGHVVNFAHQPTHHQQQQRGGQPHQNYPNRNRALPPPPYSRIEY
jgi:hypothetical protein